MSSSSEHRGGFNQSGQTETPKTTVLCVSPKEFSLNAYLFTLRNSTSARTLVNMARFLTTQCAAGRRQNVDQTRIQKFAASPSCSLLVFAALGPAQWVPRSGFGWQIDHFVGYFVLTFSFCLAWTRPLVVGGALMALAVLLEGMQAFTPDRHADLLAASISAGGAMAAVLLAELFIQASRRLIERMLVVLQRFRLRWRSQSIARTAPLTASRPVRVLGYIRL